MHLSGKIKFIILLILLFFPLLSFANATQDTTVYQELCSIRRMFCGGAALAVAVGAITFIGFMAFLGKANMGVLLITSVGLIVFLSADLLFEALFSPPAGASAVMEACSCAN